ncbi:hypothetical protein DUNSADRAFT_11511 [Dunaliella salina]|uniref:Protein YIP n=1 Tax=Dunaliella salina TaxID=3046 RepID=A0ABQ7H4F4_DUNSA|nr:hypothetical protein DUNSADRAFT_11511 [Dunaliella salina]|eukprot:KAF5841731.1 hypothetical protein DUNSADRAFT_11511 [Dunaliella salina]
MCETNPGYTPTSTAGGTSAYAGYAPPTGYAAGGMLASYPRTPSMSGNPVFEDEEPPLLEELGIDLKGICSKTRAILLHRLSNKATDELDMGGALMFVVLLGGLHLLMGKLHFGVILGWSVVHSAVMWFLVNQIAGVEAKEAQGLDLYSCCCVIGYCLAPITVFSALALLLPRGLWPVALGVLCTFWAAHTAARILSRRSLLLDDVRTLIMLPCILMFSSFTMLTLYAKNF